jgi:two-component system, OmpR family, response regulator
MSTDAPPAHRCSVLVVDDDADVRELLRVALTSDGYDVSAVASGRDALHHLRSHAKTCMILLELRVPIMDGAHFRTAQLRDRSLAWIPVVAMSARATDEETAREIGARRFLKKPLDLDEVRDALGQIGCIQARPRGHSHA